MGGVSRNGNSSPDSETGYRRRDYCCQWRCRSRRLSSFVQSPVAGRARGLIYVARRGWCCAITVDKQLSQQDNSSTLVLSRGRGDRRQHRVASAFAPRNCERHAPSPGPQYMADWPEGAASLGRVSGCCPVGTLCCNFFGRKLGYGRSSRGSAVGNVRNPPQVLGRQRLSQMWSEESPCSSYRSGFGETRGEE